MSKELFVSTTPHETKVGLVEDDLLAEVYLERENEYTLAGSIYKGRVTRVLPGMQSAFVDIGLERDAFLYVSDFMEMEDHDDLEDLTGKVVPASAPAAGEPRSRIESPPEVSDAFAADAVEGVSEPLSTREAVNREAADLEGGDSESENRGGWRGRRRRRGRRGERMPDSKYAQPAAPAEPAKLETPRPSRSERPDFTPAERPVRNDRGDRPERASERPARTERDEYGPPPGYKPIILPGESISKYARMSPSSAVSARPKVESLTKQPITATRAEAAGSVLANSFPEDEPIFAQVVVTENTFVEPSVSEFMATSLVAAESGTPALEDPADEIGEMHASEEAPSTEARHRSAPSIAALHANALEVESDEWDREMKRRHEANVAAVFGGAKSGTAAEEPSPFAETEVEDGLDDDDSSANLTIIPARVESAPELDAPGASLPSILDDSNPETHLAHSGTMEEEEIEEDEADLTHYMEELEEDAAFEEMEEETSEAGHHHEIAASAQFLNGSAEDLSLHSFAAGIESTVGMGETNHPEEGAHEPGDEDSEESELEEAQAEAEAMLDAEARGNGTVDARVEVRAASGTAGLTQRAPRPAYDRRPQRGRRPSSGGRSKFPRRNEQNNLPLISDLLKEGQEILVQIAKEPIGKKGARITSHIALPGRFLVYMPTVNHTGVSRKISSEEERQRLKRIIISERDNGQGGFIVRTAAQGADEEELRADIRFLKGLWSEIKTRAEAGKAPALIYHDLNVVERILRDQVTSDFSTIWVDTEHEYERVLRFANRFQPGLIRKVKLYSKEIPLFEQFGLSEEINKALKSKVWLKSGGYIVINQTEALVAIDVNTGKYVGKTTRLEDTIVKTNVDAIKEIVRQIRLRDLGGIIIIDFIDMDERRNRQKVMQALEEALRADRSPSKVLQFNDFGLVAITRKRVKQSLERTIGSPCPYCESTGFVKSVVTVCNDIYIEMRKMTKHLERPDVMLRVNPEVAKALKSNNGKALLEMEEMTKRTLIIKSDPALHQEQFDIN